MKHRQRSDLEGTPWVPKLDKELADTFVLLLHAGLPADKAVAYMAPDLGDETCASVASRWLKAKLTFDAAADLNGGKWETLDADDRLALALDKHFAELAYFLYTHDFSDAEGLQLQKMNEARRALTEKVGGGNDRSAVAKLYKDIVEGKVKAEVPVQLAPLDRVVVADPENLPPAGIPIGYILPAKTEKGGES